MALKAGYVGIKRDKVKDLGGGGIRYSTDEVLTGDVWYDGKPIYCRVINFETPRNLPQSGSITFEPLEYIETLLEVRFYRKATESASAWYVIAAGAGTASTTQIDVRNTVSLNNYDTMVIYYTKKDDLAE